MKLIALPLLFVAGGSLSLSAQNRTITGKVFDTHDEPLVGVSVSIDGTTKGTVTNEDGVFTLQAPDGKVVLNVSYIGYVPQKVTAGANKANLTLYLEENTVMLNETVVVGYGTQKKVNLTGAIATVGDKELKDRSAHSLTSMLQGAAAG